MNDWTVYIYNKGNSNKFWRYRIDGNDVIKEWGRIGSSVDTQVKKFDTSYEAQRYADVEVRKKLNKGYVKESTEKLDEESDLARSIGIQWKIDRIEFIKDIEKATRWTIRTSPDYNGEGVFVKLVNSWTLASTYYVLLRDGGFEEFTYCNDNGSNIVLYGFKPVSDVRVANAIRKLISKISVDVSDTISKFAAVGVRIIEIDGIESESSNIASEFKRIAKNSGVSEQVVTKFAAMNRIIEV